MARRKERVVGLTARIPHLNMNEKKIKKWLMRKLFTTQQRLKKKRTCRKDRTMMPVQ